MPDFERSGDEIGPKISYLIAIVFSKIYCFKG
jgi:hypothetical protein